MHIAEGFLPAAHAAAWTAVAAPFVVHGARRLTVQLKEHPETRMLAATAGAFSFFLSALKIPSVTGSSSHPTGVALGAVLFKPPIMAVTGVIVLFFQAILLAHGGLTTLGANAFSMAVVGPWAAYGTYKLVRRTFDSLWAGAFAAAVPRSETSITSCPCPVASHISRSAEAPATPPVTSPSQTRSCVAVAPAWLARRIAPPMATRDTARNASSSPSIGASSVKVTTLQTGSRRQRRARRAQASPDGATEAAMKWSRPKGRKTRASRSFFNAHSTTIRSAPDAREP